MIPIRFLPHALFTIDVACALCACGGGAATPTPAPSALPAPAALDWIVGVTTDDPTAETSLQAEALASLPRRAMARAVLDLGTPASDYVGPVRALAQVADLMALPLDSSAMSRLSAGQAGARLSQYAAAFGDSVSVWEVGNEVNGDWVGAQPVPKIEAMFDAARSYGKKTALTFYYENPATPGHDMLSWIDALIPAGHRLRPGLDYVLVSYYEDQNAGHILTQPEIDAMFEGLSARFPNAKVGFGEFGWGRSIPASDAQRAVLIRRFHGYRAPTVPAFVGGGFYWHFRQTMSPKTRPDWQLLREAADAGK